MSKLVSIILPVYNGAENVASSINSVIGQSYSNWELVIVNDCSTDNTLNVILDFQKMDKRIKVLNNQTNMKLPKSLNIGFREAKGDYLTWTSDDNMYKSNAIERMVSELEANRDIVMVFSDYTTIDKDNNIINEIKIADQVILGLGNTIGACFLYTREIFDKVGFYDYNLFLAEDYDYWIRINKLGTIKHISEDLYFYKLHDGSLTETRKNDINLQTYKVLEKHFMFLYLNALYEKKQFYFFEHMIGRALPEHKEKTILDLMQINPKYKFFLYRNKIKDGFIWSSLRNLKGKLVK